MRAYELAPKANGPNPEYRLSRAEVEWTGRWRAYLRAFGAVGLAFALQFPAWMAAQGRWKSAVPTDAEIAARISLVLDLGMILAYVLLAFRAFEIVRSARPPRTVSYVAHAGMTLVVAGGALDVAEDVLLWTRVDGAVQPVSMSVGLSPLMVALVLTGLAVVTAVALFSRPGLSWYAGSIRTLLRWSSRRFDKSADPDATVNRWRERSHHRVPPGGGQEPDEPARGRRVVICCSGGGVRAASFCLGGLQELVEQGKYQQAEAVVGVSGGGYMAAAYHVARWQPHLAVKDTWADPDPPVFSPNSPELRWLRRNSRYLFNSARVATLGVLSLCFGIAVNLVLLAAILGGAAWWLGWMLPTSGGISGWENADASGGSYTGDWTWVGNVWWLPLSGVLLFLLDKIAGRYITVGFQWRERIQWLSYFLIGVGSVATVLLLGLPNLLAALHDYAAASKSAYAGLIHAVGMVPDELCRAQLASGTDACGLAGAGGAQTGAPVSAGVVSAGSLVTILAAVFAVVKAAQSSLGGEKGLGKGARAVLGRVWKKTKYLVLPWVAAGLICAVLIVLLLRWTAALLTDPTLLSRWTLVYTFAGLLLAIKLGTDANRTSLHHFYRERLSWAFLLRRSGRRVEPVTYKIPLRFSDSSPQDGGPRLVSCAVANVGDLDLVPSDRGCTPFVFDDHRIGLTDQLLPAGQAITPSVMYEFAADRGYRDATIPAAMAMSGAALSPLVGRRNVRVGPYRLVLALANARLGVWLPNPLWVDEAATVRRLIKLRSPEARDAWRQLTEQDQEVLTERLNDDEVAWMQSNDPVVQPPNGRSKVQVVVEGVSAIFDKPGPFRLGKEAIGKTSLLDRWLYITDGGHYDNLGLVEALRRQPDEIIVLDASSDPEDSFQALGDAIATARMDLDCEVDIDPRKMRKLGKERATAAWGNGTVTYRDNSKGQIKLAKVVLIDGLPWDIETYAAGHPQFPRTSTRDQLYGEFDLEAYRLLGREVTKRLIENPPTQTDAEAEAPTIDVDSITVGTVHVNAPLPDASSWNGHSSRVAGWRKRQQSAGSEPRPEKPDTNRAN